MSEKEALERMKAREGTTLRTEIDLSGLSPAMAARMKEKLEKNGILTVVAMPDGETKPASK